LVGFGPKKIFRPSKIKKHPKKKIGIFRLENFLNLKTFYWLRFINHFPKNSFLIWIHTHYLIQVLVYLNRFLGPRLNGLSKSSSSISIIFAKSSVVLFSLSQPKWSKCLDFWNDFVMISADIDFQGSLTELIRSS